MHLFTRKSAPPKRSRYLVLVWHRLRRRQARMYVCMHVRMYVSESLYGAIHDFDLFSKSMYGVRNLCMALYLLALSPKNQISTPRQKQLQTSYCSLWFCYFGAWGDRLLFLSYSLDTFRQNLKYSIHSVKISNPRYIPSKSQILNTFRQNLKCLIHSIKIPNPRYIPSKSKIIYTFR